MKPMTLTISTTTGSKTYEVTVDQIRAFAVAIAFEPKEVYIGTDRYDYDEIVSWSHTDEQGQVVTSDDNLMDVGASIAGEVVVR